MNYDLTFSSVTIVVMRHQDQSNLQHKTFAECLFMVSEESSVTIMVESWQQASKHVPREIAKSLHSDL